MTDLVDILQLAGVSVKKAREEDPRFAAVSDVPVAVSDQYRSANAVTRFGGGEGTSVEVFNPSRAETDPVGFRQTVRHEMQHVMDTAAPDNQTLTNRQTLGGSLSVQARLNRMRQYAAKLSFPSVGTTVAGELDTDEMLATLIPVMDDIYNGRKTTGEMREKVEKVVAADPVMARLLFFANRNPTMPKSEHSGQKKGWFSKEELPEQTYQQMVDSALKNAPTYYPED